MIRQKNCRNTKSQSNFKSDWSVNIRIFGVRREPNYWIMKSEIKLIVKILVMLAKQNYELDSRTTEWPKKNNIKSAFAPKRRKFADQNTTLFCCPINMTH